MFIISPRYGLCNQLKAIINGILLSIKYNRNLYIDKFQAHFKNDNLVDINNILDIKEINNFLEHKIKTPIRIIKTINPNITSNLDNFKLPNINYNNVADLSCINGNIESNLDMEIIYLGNIISLDIQLSFGYLWDDYSDKNIYYFIMHNIKFNQIFYRLKDYIKQELKLTNFNCIHLRIEDDAINFFSACYGLPIEKYNEKLIAFYENNINMLSQTQNNIYVCSGMLEFDNKINLHYYNGLIENNRLLCDKKNIKLDDHYLHNRELIAIIDLLIAYDSDFFVGSFISSFSQVIKCHHTYNNKKFILFNQEHLL